MRKAKKTTISKRKKAERRKTTVSRKPNRRKTVEDRFFIKVRNCFKALLKPVSKYGLK